MLTKTIVILNRLRYEYPEEILLTLYNTLILPHLHYWCGLFGVQILEIYTNCRKKLHGLFLIASFSAHWTNM